MKTCSDIDCSVWKKPAYCVGAQLSVVQNEEMLCKHLLCAHYFAFMYIILSSPLFRLPVVLSTGLWSRCIAAAWHDSSLSIVSNSSSPLLLFSSSVMLKVRQWTVFYSLLKNIESIHYWPWPYTAVHLSYHSQDSMFLYVMLETVFCYY